MQLDSLPQYRKILLSSLTSGALIVTACGGGGETAATDDPAVTGEGRAMALAATTWSKVASEWQMFAISGTKNVRYGAGGRWIYKTLSGDNKCSNETFGSDPAYGVTKACYVSSSSAPAPAPAPAPATAPATAALSWTPSSNPNVIGYRVYFGTASQAYNQALGAGVAVDTSASYTITGLQSGQQYYFVVTAIDASGRESGFSNEATKLTQ